MKPLIVTIILSLIGVITIASSCNIAAASASDKGKPLIKDRFTYWNEYKIYVGTGFVQLTKLCRDSSRLDSNYIIQNLYSKFPENSKRKLIYRDNTCLQQLAEKSIIFSLTDFKLSALIG